MLVAVAALLWEEEAEAAASRRRQIDARGSEVDQTQHFCCCVDTDSRGQRSVPS